MDSQHSGISDKRQRTQRGATLVIFTMVAACIIVPMVGLAVDGSIAFWAKAKLSAAVDAAALAAGRNINVQQTSTQNAPTVTTIASQWFYANFPRGWLGSTIVGGQPNINYPPSANGYQTISVSASATVPLYFMRVIGQNSVTVSASAQSSRRNTFIVLVLDRSLSMGALSTQNACPIMKADAQNFVNMFTENFDTISLITFSSTANLDVPATQTFKAASTPMMSTINQINCNGTTSTAQALQLAYQTIQNNHQYSGLNVIVLFTDGQPDELVAQFPIRLSTDNTSLPDNRYPWYSTNPGDQQTTAPPSTCAVNVVSGFAAYPNPAVSYGLTGGLINIAPVSVSNVSPLINASGCNYMQGSNGYSSYYGMQLGPGARLDVAYIPNQDAYGNSTVSGYGSNLPYFGPYVSQASHPDTFAAGQRYAGKIRPDEQTISTMAAAINAADYQAQIIRNDANYKTVIYTIGLGGATDMPIDSTLLKRIANVQDSSNLTYDSTKATGLYEYAPSASQLNQAFAQVAGQILRLAQ